MSPLRALLHPGVERLPADISAQKRICQSSVSHIYTDVNLQSLTKDNARNNNNHNNALKLLKTCTSIPFVAPVLPHCQPRCSLEPPPWCALAPSCHSKANSFIYVELPHNPLYPHSHFQTALLGLVRYTPAFLCSFFTFISSVYSPNSTCPLLALFPFFALSLFLQTPHYTLSAFLILSPISHCLPPANLPFYCLSASPSAIC